MLEISANDAWLNVNERNDLSRWKSVILRATRPALLARGEKRIEISREDDIFCIGSCFAKNIEMRLVEAGCRVLSHPNFAPPGDDPFAALPFVFNVRSMVNELRWGLLDAKPTPEDAFVTDPSGYVHDPHSGISRAPLDAAQRRRAGVTANMRRIRDCRVIVMTLGLVEAWYDCKIGMYVNSTLPRFVMDLEPERYVLRVLSYTDCVEGLEECYDLLRGHGHPDFQLFLSVSPVPLAATFTQHDVLVANTYSKATQVAAARDFAARHANVQYVPSYEGVMNSARRLAWKTDLRHVTDEMVGQVTSAFLASQLGGAPTVARAVPANVRTDWPIDLAELEQYPGVPKFASAVPGSAEFPAGFPSVTASSSMSPQFDASGLMSDAKRIWHAKQPPSYPEWVAFRFEKPLTVKRLFMQCQDVHTERAPRTFQLEALIGNRWEAVLTVPQALWRYGGEWQSWPLPQEATSANFRVTINANCGDPNLLTVQNIYLAPK